MTSMQEGSGAPGLKCPFCASDESRVTDSRPTGKGTGVRRRRECQACGSRFTTYERIEYDPLQVVKKSGLREAFSREKLVKGILLACQKRPVDIDTIEEFVASVEGKFRDQGAREVSVSEIGEAVLEGLKKLDPIAYIRFASVYREFDSLDSFERLIKDVRSERLPARGGKR